MRLIFDGISHILVCSTAFDSVDFGELLQHPLTNITLILKRPFEVRYMILESRVHAIRELTWSSLSGQRLES
jgi:hypothetical protein